MNNKSILSIIVTVIISLFSIFLLGFKLTANKTPHELYNVYVDGKKIGVVKSKKEFETYVNKQEEYLKEKYEVDNIYTPKGVEIKKVVTYNDKYDSNETIYNQLVKEQNFTIKGIIIDNSNICIDLTNVASL